MTSALRQFFAGLLKGLTSGKTTGMGSDKASPKAVASPRQVSPPVPTATPAQIPFWEDDNARTPIVGESHYQRELQSLCAERPSDRTWVKRTAHLVPQDDNPYDKQAVAVLIAGTLVGFLSKEDARRLRARLRTRHIPGVTTGCDAIVKGGLPGRDGKTLKYNVELLFDLSRPKLRES